MQVTAEEPRAHSVSTWRTTCGTPATWTIGLATAIQPAASRVPSPPASTKPWNLIKIRLDFSQLVDPVRGSQAWRRAAALGGQPDGAHAEGLGGPDVGFRVV